MNNLHVTEWWPATLDPACPTFGRTSARLWVPALFGFEEVDGLPQSKIGEEIRFYWRTKVGSSLIISRLSGYGIVEGDPINREANLFIDVEDSECKATTIEDLTVYRDAGTEIDVEQYIDGHTTYRLVDIGNGAELEEIKQEELV